MPDIDCLSSTSKTQLQIDGIEFSEIPGQSTLFLDYLNDPIKLKKYYPSAVSEASHAADRAPVVLDNYNCDRNSLADILADQNQKFGAPKRTFDNIDLLRKSGTVAVLTGLQTGLFTGPLYTIYKALSAIKLTESLRGRGVDAVPVFWAATEDHDFDEIASAALLGRDDREVEFRIARAEHSKGLPVGSIVIPDSFEREFRGGFDELPTADLAPELRRQLAEIWKPGTTIGHAFCSDLQRLFNDYGLIVVDPLDIRIKRLAAPIYRNAIERADEITPALVERVKELEQDGYHSQVLVTDDYFPLFYHTDDGVRRSLRRKAPGVYRVSDTKIELTRDELLEIAANEPARFSPGVMLRPVVQDHLFPTVCYFGGGAEIAYFAQNSEVYRLLERPATTIFHRQSFTVVDSKQQSTLKKYDLKFKDLYAGYEALLPHIVDRFVNPTTARLFADAEENINLELNRLDQELSRIDPTLAANLATRRRKIVYHIGALQKKFRRAQVNKDEIVRRQLHSLFASLLPEGSLQERRLNPGTFTLRYGDAFVKSVYDSTDIDSRAHRLLYIQ
jgi:bacillithiol biosynthesis cysteine-adding enzyme BshC